jgi:hypothetical protein
MRLDPSACKTADKKQLRKSDVLAAAPFQKRALARFISTSKREQVICRA